MYLILSEILNWSISSFWNKFMKINRCASKLLQVGSIKDAEKAIAAGVDCIIAQGVEAGGHIIGTVRFFTG